MAKTRISTTVSAELLSQARMCCDGARDSSLVEAALQALVARHRATEIDEAYAAYDEQPLDRPDAWGDLDTFLDRAGQTR